MEKVSNVAVDNFLKNWNGMFPDMPLNMLDLKKPQAVTGALFRLFDRFGVSRDAVLMSPEDPDEHTQYYRDLLPVINAIRIVNHLISDMTEANLSFSIMHLLQPTIMKSYTMLYVLFNMMVFNEARLEDIAVFEEELFSHKDEVRKLTEMKDNLILQRNMEAVEKGNRKERIEQLDHDIPLLEEELKQEKEVEAEILKELEAVLEENRQMDILLEQKKAHRDGILAENARKKNLKVYDAEDIRGQAEQAAQNVREAEEKLSALSLTLTQKESSLNNLQTLKPTLDQANTLLHDIMRASDSIKDLENGDLDADSAEGELEVLETEQAELEAALAEAEAAAAAAADRLQRLRARHNKHQVADDSALREAEENYKRAAEAAEKAAALTRTLKENTLQYEREKHDGTAELAQIKGDYIEKVTSMQDHLLIKMEKACKKVEEQKERLRKL